MEYCKNLKGNYSYRNIGWDCCAAVIKNCFTFIHSLGNKNLELPKRIVSGSEGEFNTKFTHFSKSPDL